MANDIKTISAPSTRGFRLQQQSTKISPSDFYRADSEDSFSNEVPTKTGLCPLKFQRMTSRKHQLWGTVSMDMPIRRPLRQSHSVGSQVLSLCRHLDRLFGPRKSSGKGRHIHTASGQLFLNMAKSLPAGIKVTWRPADVDVIMVVGE